MSRLDLEHLTKMKPTTAYGLTALRSIQPTSLSTWMQSNPSDLQLTDLIDYYESIESETLLESAFERLKVNGNRFAAVVQDHRVVGLCSNAQIAVALGSRFGFSLNGRISVARHLLPESMIVRKDASVFSVVNQALTRKRESFYEDIVVVDEHDHLIGLIEVAHMAALQTMWVDQHACAREIINRNLQIEIQERKRAEQTTQDALHAAEAAVRVKSEFLATMSHELRTPLNAVLGFAELLGTVPMGPVEANWCAQINSSGQLLLRLINDVLDLAKIEAGRMQITPVLVDLRKTLQSFLGHHQASASKKRLELNFTSAPEVPVRVKIDSLRLGQITGNLLSNAIKFTANGSVTLELNCTREGENRARLNLLVKDTGIGIQAEQLDRIFDKFTQADSSITRNYGGTGLGLAISRQLAELMGGALTVVSRINEGTCFTFSVPVEVVQWDQPSAIQGPAVITNSPYAAPTRPVTRHVLLVEDNVTNQELMISILTRMNFVFKVAQNGFQAVALAQKNEFSCILMDCQMPEMDGYEATRRIRANEAALGRLRTPIIALTANAMSGAEELCIAAGMDDYIAKPFNQVEFWRVFDSWVKA